MRILFLGFTTKEKLNDARAQLEAGGVWLFAVVCGGSPHREESLVESWAKDVGAPVELIIEDDMEKLIDKVVAQADFIFADKDGIKDNNFARRVIMKFQGLGKHGIVF